MIRGISRAPEPPHIHRQSSTLLERPVELLSLISPPALAEKIGVGVNCLAKWRLTGEGPPFIRIGRRVHYHPDDVSNWLQARRVRSTSEAPRA